MPLKNKIALLVASLFAVYVLAEYAIQRLVLLPAFVELETHAATSNTERAIQALGREVELLIPSANDWASWDDSYDFMEDRNEIFKDQNLYLQSLEGLRINFLAFYDIEGRKVWGASYDFENEKELPLGELSEESLEVTHPLLAAADVNKTVSGLTMTPGGTLMVVSRPILKSDGQGPSRGRFVVGRLLNEAAIARLAHQVRADLTITPLPQGLSTVPYHHAESETIIHGPIILSSVQDTTQGSSDLFDIADIPILRIQVDTPQVILAQGRVALRFASLSLVLSGLVVLLALLIFLRNTVFKPLALLTRHAGVIGSKGDLDECLEITSNDEIGTLAHEFNVMVERLRENRQRLLEQSYQSGIAEMATGVLHNVGNVLNSVNVSCNLLMDQIRQSRIGSVAKVAQLLNRPEDDLGHFMTADPRGKQIPTYLDSLAASLQKEHQEMLVEAEALRDKIDHIKEIVSMQQAYGRVSGLLETLPAAKLMEDALTLNAGALVRHGVDVVRDYDDVPPITVDKHKILQILLNLIHNAKYACSENDGPKVITLRIFSPAPDRVAFQVRDSGVGIRPEHMTRIFQHGFTTRKTGHGFGLHSGALAARDLGGSLTAHSDGPGLGATFTLEIPTHSGGIL